MDNSHENLLDNLKRDIAFTAGNYGQMYDRLLLRDRVSRIAIVYYSIVTIIYALFSAYFTVNHKDGLEFFSICVSIVSLVASLMISFAKYPERVLKAMKALDNMKRLKKELAKYSCADLYAEEYKLYDDFINRYHTIVDEVELRAEIDYYRTCKCLKKKEEHADGWQKLSFFQKTLAYLARPIEYLCYLLLFLAPFIPVPFVL